MLYIVSKGDKTYCVRNDVIASVVTETALVEPEKNKTKNVDVKSKISNKPKKKKKGL